MLKVVLPSPALSVGLTGHRKLPIDSIAAEAVENGIGAILGALQRALTPAIAQESAFFSGAAPIMRLITMGADGADLAGARAAGKYGLAVSYIIPFALDEYREDFSPASAAIAAEIMSQGGSLLELPGQRAEGARAYERANEIILANIDLLLAVWDGGRARGRAGTGEVVQAAVAKGVPIIVIDPQAPGKHTILAVPPMHDFEPPTASDLARTPLPTDLTDLVHRIMRPPPKLAQRRGLIDLIAETPKYAAWRFEYPFLLRIVAGAPTVGWTPATAAAPNVRSSAGVATHAEFALANQPNVAALDQARDIVDSLAVQYGTLFRSSSVSSYLVVILGSWVSGVIGLLVPTLSATSIVVQVVANGLVLADSAIRARHRWQERWLDYRVVAERLRWLKFRYSFGLGAVRRTQIDARRNTSWTDWYLQRMAHALGPPRGKIDAISVATAADQLLQVEIPDQISYHRTAVRQLGTFERRLAFGGRAALVAALGVAVALAFTALAAGGFNAVGWKPIAIVLLAVLPATMAGLNGLRVEADLVRLVERSAQTIALLFRIKRVVLAASRDYDHVASGMQRLASIMGDELAEWRFVIESRRSRGSRRGIGAKRSRLLQLLHNLASKRPPLPPKKS